MISYRKLRGYKYQTTHHTSCQLPEDLFYELQGTVTLTTGGGYITFSLAQRSIQIKKGYCWDGPSGPTIDTDNFMRGSLFHDAWYQIFREYDYYRRFRNDADKLLRRHCLEDGMSKIRAWGVYHALKVFGRRAAGG